MILSSVEGEYLVVRLGGMNKHSQDHAMTSPCRRKRRVRPSAVAVSRCICTVRSNLLYAIAHLNIELSCCICLGEVGRYCCCVLP